jgi:hypothetical protein
MSLLPEATVGCPYCGESIGLVIDDSVPDQEYTEDCQVCCRAIEVRTTVTPAGGIEVAVKREDEV